MTREAKITVNGTELTNAQSMAFRVALQAFILDLQGHGLGDDNVGIALAERYLACLAEIQRLIMGGKR